MSPTTERCEVVDLDEHARRVSLAHYSHVVVKEITTDLPGNGIILIPWLRTRGRPAGEREISDLLDITTTVASVSRDLFDKGHADALFVQETTPDLARSYDRVKMVFPLVMAVHRHGWTSQYKEFCESRPWRLVGSSLEDSTPTGLEARNAQHQKRFQYMLTKWQRNGWVDSVSSFELRRTEINADVHQLFSEYGTSVADYYAVDPGAAVLFEQEGLKEQAVIASAQVALHQGARRVMVVYDHANEQGLRAEAKLRGVPLTVIRVQDAPAYVERTDDERRIAFRKDHFWLPENLNIHFPAIIVRYNIDVSNNPFYRRCIIGP